MERIINYSELPKANGESVYLRMESDPNLYLCLMSKGYRIVHNAKDADDKTIFVTGCRQYMQSFSDGEYKNVFDTKVEGLLSTHDIVKPKTFRFSYQDLIDFKYKIPFVLKNENQNGGREKFLIATEEDYYNLIYACNDLIKRKLLFVSPYEKNDIRNQLDYGRYLNANFFVQEYISTPSEYCTSLRVVTSSSDDLLYATLKYKKPEGGIDDTTLLGYLLREIYPLSTKSIVSNTLSGGDNIIIGESNYNDNERRVLESHGYDRDQFDSLIQATRSVHEQCKEELGIMCGFDYIYDRERDKWFFLEYHSKPMLKSYCTSQGIPYETKDDRLISDGRVRATALSLTLKKNR